MRKKTLIVVHKHRNPENTKFTKLVQVRNFITVELKVIWPEERETHTIFLCWLLLHRQLSTQHRAAPVAHKVVWLHPALNPDSLVRTQELNSLLFLKSQPTLPVGDVTHIPWSQFPIWDFYFDISEWLTLSARAWTPTLM